MSDRRPVDVEHENWKRKRRREDDDEDFEDAVWKLRRAEQRRDADPSCGRPSTRQEVRARAEEALRRGEAEQARRAYEATARRALQDPGYRLLALRLRGEADQAHARWSDAVARLRRDQDP